MRNLTIRHFGGVLYTVKSPYRWIEPMTNPTAKTMLELADEFDNMAKAHKAMGEKQEAANYTLAATALRATAAAQPVADDEDGMEKISALIARLQETKDRWGNICVYLRRGGLAWGAGALNRGVFDLQAFDRTFDALSALPPEKKDV